MKTKRQTLVPRNPYAVAAARKKAGSHEKTKKRSGSKPSSN